MFILLIVKQHCFPCLHFISVNYCDYSARCFVQWCICNSGCSEQPSLESCFLTGQTISNIRFVHMGMETNTASCFLQVDAYFRPRNTFSYVGDFHFPCIAPSSKLRLWLICISFWCLPCQEHLFIPLEKPEYPTCINYGHFFHGSWSDEGHSLFWQFVFISLLKERHCLLTSWPVSGGSCTAS